MEEGPSLLQRQAIGNLLQTITNNHPTEWKNWLFDSLADWNLLPNSDISLSEYYNTLANLPAYPKRLLCQIVIMGWNEHHDLLTLYDSINSLIYLKVCGPSEYFFMQQVYNFIAYFKDVCDDYSKIFIQEHNPHKYTLRFTEDGHMMGKSLALVDLEMSRTTDAPMVVVVPWYISFDNLNGLPEGTTQSQIQSTSDFIESEIMPIICNEFAKRHCSWIYSNCDFSFRNHPHGVAPIIFLNNIEYVDGNGC